MHPLQIYGVAGAVGLCRLVQSDNCGVQSGANRNLDNFDLSGINLVQFKIWLIITVNVHRRTVDWWRCPVPYVGIRRLVCTLSACRIWLGLRFVSCEVLFQQQLRGNLAR